MTDNTQELDEILNKAMAVKIENSAPLMPSSVKVVEVRLQYQEAIRQLILDWHNKLEKNPSLLTVAQAAELKRAGVVVPAYIGSGIAYEPILCPECRGSGLLYRPASEEQL